MCNTLGGIYQCTSNTPDCPYTDTTAPSSAAPAAVTESTIACNGSLLVDLFMGDGSTTAVTLIYPLSQAELEYVLKQLGVGSQSWKSSPPTVTYL